MKRFQLSVKDWSIWTRLLVALLLVELVTMSIVLAATIAGYEQAGAQNANFGTDLQSVVLTQALTAVFAFGATATVAVLFVKEIASRINLLTGLVKRQVNDDNLNLALESDSSDELGKLIVALNELGSAYHLTVNDLGRRADEMATINFVAETINKTFDLQEVLDVSLREVIRASNCDVGALYMWDDRPGMLHLVSYVGLSENIIRRIFSFKMNEGLVGQAAESQSMILVEDLRSSEFFESENLDGMPMTLVSIPFTDVPGQLLGVMLVGNKKKRQFDDAEINLLRTVAHQVALAIDKAQLYAQVSMHAEELERIVEARTKMLNEAIAELSYALERAKEADRIKSLLLTTVSHELRTPLATIKGNTSMLRAHLSQIEPDDLIQHLGDIEEESDKLTYLISNLLEMSRIEAGVLRIQPQEFDLVDTLNSAVNAASVRMPDRVVTLHLPNEPLAVCYGDARRIDQIVANLMNNAAKYSAAGQPIEVFVKQQDDMLVVSVKDRGKGITEDHLKNIFDRFYQIGETGDSVRDGIGLGLSICRGLVDAHGGEIWVESKPKQGSTFSFSLPIARMESPITEEAV